MSDVSTERDFKQEMTYRLDSILSTKAAQWHQNVFSVILCSKICYKEGIAMNYDIPYFIERVPP